MTLKYKIMFILIVSINICRLIKPVIEDLIFYGFLEFSCFFYE